ncbi:mycofactocin-coupled SDR family oxidoreductase [Actinomadura welshii]|uniref:mycofactocin-coupled SDR family oxidoreductase n=1 Tax=Actinomadura welshii TaxID=3103817 RepID=UPI0003AD568F|nr:mycofactocin-coupled SDR family oxidoreductase [Actinomadura madurae]
MSARFEGKVAFITGIARGQGRAHAVRLASEGADIIGLDLAGPIPHVVYDSPTQADLDETINLVEGLGRRIIAKPGDVREFDAMREFVDGAVGELGRLDVVVANAGVCLFETWDQITPETFKFVMDTNSTGVWNTVMASAPHMVEAGGGSIVLTSSYAGKKMQPFMVHYTASKHSVIGLTRAFAAELGQYGIRVNSVDPGPVDSGMMTGGTGVAYEATNKSNPRLTAMGTTFLPIYRNEAEDIANAVAFLASDEARTITAEHLSVDMGQQYY